MTRIAVTGMGALCAIGTDTGEIARSLLKGEAGVTESGFSSLTYRPVLGRVSLTNEQLWELIKVPHIEPPHSRTALLALAAAMQATANDLAHQDTVVISASTVGGMDVTEQHLGTWSAGGKDHIERIREHPVGFHTGLIAKALGSHAFQTTISTACSSSANTIAMGARMLRNGMANKVLAGGADALCRFTIEGFRALSAMDPLPCRPFSEDRNGMNLGEGAAYLLLERLDDVVASGRTPIAILSGWANRNDAFHQTATSDHGEGPYLAMQAALQVADLHVSAIDHINAHGTGTTNNDATEATAMERLFPQVPAFTSTKAYTGHTLGAAGALEAVISMLCMCEGFIPGMPRNTIPMAGHRTIPEAGLLKRRPRHVLSNSFGFGGNDSSLIFSSPA